MRTVLLRSGIAAAIARKNAALARKEAPGAARDWRLGMRVHRFTIRGYRG
jgi:hypothetical protein